MLNCILQSYIEDISEEKEEGEEEEEGEILGTQLLSAGDMEQDSTVDEIQLFIETFPERFVFVSISERLLVRVRSALCLLTVRIR